MPGKHGPNRLGNYLSIHESCMADLLAEGFVAQDECSFAFLPARLLLEGRVICQDRITLEVHKEIAVLEGRGMTALVQTRNFRYHGWLRGAHNILRYDSSHSHRPFPHKHLYETFGTGRESGILPLTEDAVPTMLEVIRELHAWHTAHAGNLRGLQ